MKELNYDHLKLDNFFSLRSDLATNRKKFRKLKDFNKENDCVINGLPSMSSGRGNVDSSQLGTTPLITPTVVTEKSGNVPLTKKLNNQLNAKQGVFFHRSAIMSTTNNDGRSNFMQTPHSTFDHVEQSSDSIPFSDITNQSTGQLSTRKTSNQPQNSRKGVPSKMHRRITPAMVSISTELSVEDNLIHNDYDSAELSTISEMQADEGDMIWDDEYDFVEGEQLDAEENETEHNAVPKGYASLGPPTECCSKCHAIMWKEERVNKNVKNGDPKFSICCAQGQIKLPRTPPTPSYLQTLYSDPKKSNSFKRSIRLYNAILAFTSMGDGYHDEIPYVDSKKQSKKKRKRITMKEYYSYKLQVRKDEGLYVRLAEILLWDLPWSHVHC
ncbi:hypothetical protein POM88_026587 [Heracleum sosnowskyi]|uniref:Uncharacterized protein n=1 Tax=Heracleum sosnowskyi TaxID=360622 RepID=A0AAD8I8K3_9APIA|nr:hypothetical protein POM88_026587 [Heracleum sosnowskyi]